MIGTWIPALEVSGPDGKLVSEQIPLVQFSHSYKPVKVTQPAPGILVYDLGQNFAGWPKIEVSGAKGSWVKLVPGELLDQHGLVTQNSANGTPDFQTSFTYILNGNGIESWHPRFTYYGFRYVQVERSHSPKPPIMHSSYRTIPARWRCGGWLILHFRRAFRQDSSSDRRCHSQ